MRRERDKIIYSPSDLVTFSRSRFASWMDRLHLERPEAAVPDEWGEATEILFRKGREHEDALLDRFRSEGRGVVDAREAPDRFEGTRRAVAGRAEVVYQAALRDGGFEGHADFLVLDGAGSYEVWDAKLSRSVRPEHVLQLCCYADLLRPITGTLPEVLVVALGNWEVRRLRAADFFWYASRMRGEFLDFMARFDPDGGCPEPECHADHGRWASHAKAWFEERDHPIRVAGILKSQIARLAGAGIATMRALAETELDGVAGIGREGFPRLARQARLQVASAGRESPAFEILPRSAIPRAGLALLPPRSPGNIYLDLEGFPLAERSLEYLFGAVTTEGGEARFRDWWAHDEVQERAAFEGFVDFAVQRWRRDSSLHIYHYGGYEVSALRRLMGRYGTREDEVDEFLRGEVFVDLLGVVRQGVAIGEPGYSLKNVERLYRPAREGAVADAAASIVEYDRWLQSGEPQDWKLSPILAGIREYNRDDCVSTSQLAAWLRARQTEAGIAFVAKRDVPPEAERPLSEANEERKELAAAMLQEAAAMAAGDPEAGERRRLHELLAHLVEFHRREQKPQWWYLFDRGLRTHEELVEDPECLGDLRIAGDPAPLKRSMVVPYSFDPDQDTKVEAGGKTRLAHATNVVAIVEDMDAGEGRLLLKFGPKSWKILEGEPPERLSLVPFDMVDVGVIQDAISAVAQEWRDGAGLPSALEDFLRRRPPRVLGHPGGALIRPDESPSDAVVRVTAGLDGSCLVIQGPPGSGKTASAAKAIVKLLGAGRNVGITSNSHKAIENLLAACDREHGGGLPFLKAGDDPSSPILRHCTGSRHCKGAADAGPMYEGGLVGGTAWLFSRPDWAGVLDHLFIDEAGQVSLANLAGVSRSARNLVVLGDQMQLSQPIQGTHPGESGQSLMNYYLGERRTIPDDLGIFLARTWRLHDEICTLISETVYEGRLRPEPVTRTRVLRLPPGRGALIRREAGIVFVPVEHDGNCQASDEEVAAIRSHVAELLGLQYFDGERDRPLAIDDLLFVAPYNMQVRRLRAALGPAARVASVDKFQGQEAPVVVLSLCASPGEFGPRGSAFLLDLNRLNVAISRARSLAVVVGDPRLAQSQASSIEEMRRFNLLCRLIGVVTQRQQL